MDRRQLLFGMTALGLASNLALPDFLNAQNIEMGDSLPPTSNVGISDRERVGFRGPIRMSVAENETRLGKSVATREYDPDGRLLVSRSSYPGGEWENTSTYDAEGRLLRKTNKSGDSSSMLTYSYDENRRLLRIANSDGSNTDFHYDSQDRRTETQTIPPRPGESRGAVTIGAGTLFASTEAGRGLYDGGTVTKRYDDHDLPVESQILDAEGNLLARITRSYDSNGRLTKERMIPENWEIGFAKQVLENAPEEFRTEEILQQVREQMRALLKASNGDTEKSYTYDAQNRMTGTHMESGLASQDTEIEYNDQGDITVQRETSTYSREPDIRVSLHQDEAGNMVKDKPRSEWPAEPEPRTSSFELRFTYEYDSRGNWTEQTSILPDGSRSITRRTLTYY